MNKYQMFSACFKNTKELQGFLRFSNSLVITTIPETLGVAFKLWQSIKKGKDNFIKSIDRKTKEERI